VGSGDEGAEPGAGANVDDPFTRFEQAQREGVADTGEGLDCPVGQRVDHMRVVARPGRAGPAGVKAEGVSGVERDGAVLVADLAADRVAIGTCLFTDAASPRRKW